jgi:hypothetical protein
MDFKSIEAARLAMTPKLSAAKLCAAAGINPTTYSRLRRKPHSGQVQTLQRLSDALARVRPAARP